MHLISSWWGCDSLMGLELWTLLGALWQPLPVVLENSLLVASADLPHCNWVQNTRLLSCSGQRLAVLQQTLKSVRLPGWKPCHGLCSSMHLRHACIGRAFRSQMVLNYYHLKMETQEQEQTFNCICCRWCASEQLHLGD